MGSMLKSLGLEDKSMSLAVMGDMLLSFEGSCHIIYNYLQEKDYIVLTTELELVNECLLELEGKEIISENFLENIIDFSRISDEELTELAKNNSIIVLMACPEDASLIPMTYNFASLLGDNIKLVCFNVKEEDVEFFTDAIRVDQTGSNELIMESIKITFSQEVEAVSRYLH